MSWYIYILLTLTFPLPGFGIVGGQPAEPYPFFVLILVGNHNTCGGTIVAKNYIVTAAHCLYNKDIPEWVHRNEVNILHGSFSSSEDWRVKLYKCSFYLTHQFYDPLLFNGKGKYDIAMVRLFEEIEFDQSTKLVLRPCLRDEHTRYGRYGTVIGLGLTNQYPDTQSKQLMEAVLEVDENCGKYDRQHVFISSHVHLCYKYPRSSPCKGDAGGPLVYKENAEAVCLLGIFSFNNETLCDHPDFPSVFISAGSFRNWIRRKIIS